MPPSRKPSSSHSSRPARHTSHSSHHSSHSSHSSYHSTHHSSYHRPQYHSNYSHHSSNSGFLGGLLLGSHLGQQNQSGGTTIVNNYAQQQPAAQLYDCPYCGSRVTGVPSQNGLSSLSCPNCGGVLQQNNAVFQQQQPAQQFIQSPAFAGDYNARAVQSNRNQGRSCLATVIGFVMVAVIIACILFFLFRGNAGSNQGYSNTTNYNYSDSHEDSIYVPALERYVDWNNEYDSYYDRETDCYFFLNQEMNPPIWQYWFEEVSSRYGDYGWMEWDDDERCWYIQEGANSWVKLPESEYTNYLWHMD